VPLPLPPSIAAAAVAQQVISFSELERLSYVLFLSMSHPPLPLPISRKISHHH